MSSVEGSRTSFSKVVSFNQYDITENVQHMCQFNDKPSSRHKLVDSHLDYEDNIKK